MPGVLEHQTSRRRTFARRTPHARVEAANHHGSGIGLREPGGKACQRGLAAAVGAGHAQHLARAHLQRDAVEGRRRRPGVGQRDVRHGQHHVARRRPGPKRRRESQSRVRIRRPVGGNPARRKAHHAGCPARGAARVSVSPDDRHTPPDAKTPQDCQQRGCTGRIKICGRLVQDKQRRLHRQDRGKRKPLLLAARQRGGVAIVETVQPHVVECRRHTRPHRARRDAQALQPKRHFFGDGALCRGQPGVIKHHPNVPRHRVHGQRQGVQSGNPDPPCDRGGHKVGHNAIEQPQQR